MAKVQNRETSRQSTRENLKVVNTMHVFTKNSPKIAMIHAIGNNPVFYTNLRKLCEFYGLGHKSIDLSDSKAVDEFLASKETCGFLAFGISGLDLENMDSVKIENIESLVKNGTKLLIYVDAEPGNTAEKALKRFTGGIISSMKHESMRKKLMVSSECPSITREFTGYAQSFPVQEKYYVPVIKVNSQKIESIINYVSDKDRHCPIFLKCAHGKGEVFILGTEQNLSLEDYSLEQLYKPESFTLLVPLMMFLRYSGGAKAWHRKTNYANLTIDDPSLIEPCGNLCFSKLLKEMKKHEFHTTIAFIPRNYRKSEKGVINLFLRNPDYCSLAVHGNDHDGQEFSDQLCGSHERRNKTLLVYERKIAQAVARMDAHKKLTGIDYDRIMIFPHSICAEPVLTILKKYGFELTANAQRLPLGAKTSKDTSQHLRPANLDFRNFPIARRSQLLEEFGFNLFIYQPLLLYVHQDFFSAGSKAFNLIADKINNKPGRIEWKNLSHIGQHLYLEKINDNGSVEVQMFSNHIVLENHCKTNKLFHVFKKEMSNSKPAVFLDCKEVSYS